jgi:ABC-type protease/lipase transport system fused ATPase/permease subunit
MDANDRHLGALEQLSDLTGGLSVSGKVFRLMLQSALLGTGAYLAINGQMSAGAIIAVSIAAARALAPLEIAIGQWKGLVATRQARAAPRRRVCKSAGRG